MSSLPVVAIVGRPNVGKSTLFNRLAGKKLALVDDLPGVTRDRREGDGQLFDLDFKIIDTAGFEEADRSEEHTSELQSLMRISYAVFCLKIKFFFFFFFFSSLFFSFFFFFFSF